VKRMILLIMAICGEPAFAAGMAEGPNDSPASAQCPTAPAPECPSARDTSLSSFWRDVHLAAGLGLTYRTRVTGKVVPASATWNDNRWEFFTGYFSDQKLGGLIYQGYPAHEGLAPPMWAFTMSRRLNFVDRRQFQSFVGFGAAYLNTSPCQNSATSNDHTPVLDYYEYVYHGCDKLNGSKLNYALQIGMRFYDRHRDHALEFAYRHFSNAGMTSGNRGEDLLTALLVF